MARRVEIAVPPTRPLSPPLLRQLSLVFDTHWPDGGDCDVDALSKAVVAFAFDHELVWLPDDPQRLRDGLRFYQITRAGDVRAVYFGTVAAPAVPPTDFERI